MAGIVLKGFTILSALAKVRSSPVLDIRQAAPTLPAPWTSVGCFSDTPASRTLRIAAFTDVTNMTIESCFAFCTPARYMFAGVEFSRECYCDNVIEPSGLPINFTMCNMPCTGDSTEICGGQRSINIFRNTDILVPPPRTTKQTVGTFQFQGCYLDGVSGAPRGLSNQIDVANVTAESCTTACQNAGFPIAGMEFGDECWCDSYMPFATKAPDADCSFACAGDETEICGAANRITVYVDTSIAPLDLNGCLADSQVNPCSGFQFNLQMVQLDGGGTPVLLGAVFSGTFGHGTPTQRGIFELSGVNSTLAQDEFSSTTEAHIFTLSGNAFLPSVNLAIPQVFSVVPVKPPQGSSQIFLPDIDVNPFEGYCAMPNPLSPSTFIGPPVLAVTLDDGTTGKWGSCTLSGLVSFDPLTPILTPTSANGVCNDVILLMVPPIVGV